MGGLTFYGAKHSNMKVKKLDMTEKQFENGLRQSFRYGSASKYLFCGHGPQFMPTLKTIPTSKTYGVKVGQYLSPHGTVNVIENPMLGDFGVLVDIHSFALRPLQGRKVRMLTNCQNPGDDYIRDVLISEWTLEVRQPDDIVLIGKPGLGPPGVQEGSTFGSKTTSTDEDAGFEYEASLDEILGMEDPIWRV
jgi:hypothetical protein